MAGVIFKFYSGLHLGAVLELKEGTWVFGSDDSADIVMADAGVAARHAAFVIDEKGVSQTPLDGVVTGPSAEDVVPDGIPEGSLFRVGSVLMAWGPADADPGFWQGVESRLSDLLRPSKTADSAADGAAGETPAGFTDEEIGLGAAFNAALDKAGEGDVSVKDEPVAMTRLERLQTMTFEEKRSVLLKSAAILGLIGLLLLPTMSRTVDVKLDETLAGLKTPTMHRTYTTVYHCDAAESLRGFFERAGVNDGTPGPQPRDLESFLRGKGYDALNVSRAPSGAYHWKGTVENDRQRADLLALAKRVPWPVVIDVTVLSDVTDAYRAAFNTLGYYPDVSLLREKDTLQLTVSAYMISNVAEEAAFREVAQTLPADALLPAGAAHPVKVEVKRHIRHRNDMESLVTGVLKASDLDTVHVKYLPGELVFTTLLTPEQTVKLDRAMASLTEKSDVPVSMRVENARDAGNWVELKKESQSNVRAQRGPAFRVTAVSGGTLRFVTLSTGEKVFAGGKLPGGYRLIAIQGDKLILEKNKKRTTYPLRIK